MYQGSTLNLEQVSLPSTQCLMKKDRKPLYGLANCYLSLALGLQHAYLWIILTILAEFQWNFVMYTFIHLTASSWVLEYVFKPFCTSEQAVLWLLSLPEVSRIRHHHPKFHMNVYFDRSFIHKYMLLTLNVHLASFLGSPLAPTKVKNGRGEPGIDSHVISLHDDIALTKAESSSTWRRQSSREVLSAQELVQLVYCGVAMLDL